MRKLALYLLSFIILLLSYGYIIFIKKIKYEEVVFNNETDGIAVLTGGKGRIKLGLELFSLRSNIQLIISGVDKKVSDSTIIPIDFKNNVNITIDKESESTYQNAMVIKKWAKTNELRNVTVITSYYHMPRSMILMKSFSPFINFYPYPVKKIISYKRTYKENIFYYFFLTEEYIKYLVSHLTIFIK